MAITERIAVVFDGDAKGAVGAAKQTADATDRAAAAEEKAAAARAKSKQAIIAVEKASIGLAAAQKNLTKVTADATATDLQKRKAALAVQDAELKHGEATRLATVAEKNATKATAQHAAALQDTGDAAKASGAEIKENSKLLLAGAAAAGLAAAKFAATAIFDLGETRSRLQGQLGLTTEDAAKYGKLAGKLYSDNFGGSVGEVADALAKVRQSSKQLQVATDADLQQITGDVLNVAQVFGVDLNKVIDATGKLLANRMAPNARAALDVLVTGFQSGTNSADDLLDTFSEYPPQFQKLGIDASTALGLMNQGLVAGARNTDIIADAFKEFSIRAIDGSTLTAQGFQDLGLDANVMGQRIAAGGKTANDALDLTLDRLRAIPDPVHRSQVAVALFGTQAEDLGAALFALDPSSAVAGLDKVSGAAQRLGDALGASPRARVDAFMRTLKTGATEAVGGALKEFNDLNPELKAGAAGLLAVAVAAKPAAVAITAVTTRTEQLVTAVKGLKGGGIVGAGALAALGVSLGVLTERLNKGKRETKEFFQTLFDVAGADTTKAQMDVLRKAILDTNDATKLSEKEKFRAVLAYKELEKQLGSETRAQEINKAETKEAGHVVKATGTYVDRFGQTVDKATGKIKDQKSAMEKLNYEFDILNGKNISAAEASIEFQGSLRDLRDAVKDNGKTLADNSEKGQANQKAFIEAAKAAQEYSARIGDTSGYEAGRQAGESARKSLAELAKTLGLNKAEVDKLIAAFFRVPTRVLTKAEVDDIQARKAAEDLRKRLALLKDKRVTVNVTSAGIQQVVRDIQRIGGRDVVVRVSTGSGAGKTTAFSKGGEVKGGTPGRDSVPALLMPGERVLTVAENRAYRLRGGGGASEGGPQPVVLQVQPGGMTGLERVFLDWLARAVSTRGGSVQSVVGRG